MAIGSGIIVSAEPRGIYLEGIIGDTSKPGTMMQLQATVMTQGVGEFTWVCYAPGTSGDPRLVAILLADELQGGDVATAYVSGKKCFLYCPLAGEILNILLKDIAGTGDTHTIGDRVYAETGSGKFLVQSTSANISQFTLLETLAAPTADTLCAAMRS
jgi:hypothetical protein